jgi:hypothetical protein
MFPMVLEGKKEVGSISPVAVVIEGEGDRIGGGGAIGTRGTGGGVMAEVRCGSGVIGRIG